MVISSMDTDRFRYESYVWLVVFCGIVAWIWIGMGLQSAQVAPSQGILLVLLTLGSGLLINWLNVRRYRLSVLAFLATQVLFIAYATWTTQNLGLMYTFALTIFMAGALLGPDVSLISAALIIPIQIMLATSVSASTSLVAGQAIYLTLAAFVSWRASRGARDAYVAADSSARKAEQNAAEARIHRAELHRTLKSLDLSNYQLQKANTELFYAREIADEALRFKSEFAANISHELRTSLNLILGFSETMSFAQHSYGVRLPPPYLPDITEIYRNSRHLLSLIDDILDLTKLDTGRMGLHWKETDVKGLVSETVAMIQPQVAMKGLDLSVEYPDPPPRILLDAGRIRQVLLNLLANATRVTERGGISVRVYVEEDGWLYFEIADTGPGIADEELAQIFDEFHQLRGTSGGAGLGLAISQRIIHLHGGRIHVESRAGAGTTFRFQLPFDTAAIPSSRSLQMLPPARPTDPVVVYIGDDECDEAKLLRRHLDAFHVQAVPTWEESVGIVRQLNARAIVTTDGSDGASAQVNSVPVLSCTLPGSTQMAAALGIATYIQKPASIHSIQAAMRRVAPGATSVLVVDDEPAAVRMLERMLMTHNTSYVVYRAYSGMEALGRLRAQPVDVVLLDMGMPDGDGQWLISELKQEPQLSSIPIIGVSGQMVEDSLHSKSVSIACQDGFTTSETLHYLKSLLAVVPPAPSGSAPARITPAEHLTSALPLPEGQTG